MSIPLGNPTHKTAITVTDTEQVLTLTHGLTSLELQNTGNADCYFGATGVDSNTGGVIYSAGDRKVFENLPSNWQVYVICAAGQSTTLKRIDYV